MSKRIRPEVARAPPLAPSVAAAAVAGFEPLNANGVPASLGLQPATSSILQLQQRGSALSEATARAQPASLSARQLDEALAQVMAEANDDKQVYADLALQVESTHRDRGVPIVRRMNHVSRPSSTALARNTRTHAWQSCTIGRPYGVYVLRIDERELPATSWDQFDKLAPRQAAANSLVQLLIHSVALQNNYYRDATMANNDAPPLAPGQESAAPFAIFLEAELGGTAVPQENYVRHVSDDGFMSSPEARRAHVTGYRLWIFQLEETYPLAFTIGNLVDAEDCLARGQALDTSVMLKKSKTLSEKRLVPLDARAITAAGGGGAGGGSSNREVQAISAITNQTPSMLTRVADMSAKLSSQQRFRILSNAQSFACAIDAVHYTKQFSGRERRGTVEDDNEIEALGGDAFVPTAMGQNIFFYSMHAGKLSSEAHPAYAKKVLSPVALFERLGARRDSNQLDRLQCTSAAYYDETRHEWSFPRPDCVIRVPPQRQCIDEFSILYRPDFECTYFSHELQDELGTLSGVTEFADLSAMEQQATLQSGLLDKPITSAHGIRRLISGARDKLDQRLTQQLRTVGTLLDRSTLTPEQRAQKQQELTQTTLACAARSMRYIKETAMRMYNATCARSTAPDLSKPGALIIQWQERRAKQGGKSHVSVPVHIVDLSLSMLSNQIAITFYQLDKLRTLVGYHDVAFMLLTLANDSYRYGLNDDGLHANMLLWGPAATSKSFILNLLRASYIPRTFSATSHSSAKSITSSTDRIDRIDTYDELPIGMVCGDARQGGNANQADIHKDALARGEVSSQVCFQDTNGNRITMEHSSESIGVVLAATNHAARSEAAESRFLVVKVGTREASTPLSHVIDIGGANSGDSTKLSLTEYFYESMRTRQFLNYHVEKLIMCKALHDVSTPCFGAIFQTFSDHLRRRYLLTVHPRTNMRMQLLVRRLVIAAAIQALYDLPGVSPYYMRPFDVTQLLDIDPYLHDTEEMVFFALELLRDAYTRSSRERVLRGLYEEYFLDKPMNKCLAPPSLLERAFPSRFGNAEPVNDTITGPALAKIVHRPREPLNPDQNDYSSSFEYLCIMKRPADIVRDLKRHTNGACASMGEEEIRNELTELAKSVKTCSYPYKPRVPLYRPAAPAGVFGTATAAAPPNPNVYDDKAFIMLRRRELTAAGGAGGGSGDAATTAHDVGSHGDEVCLNVEPSRLNKSERFVTTAIILYGEDRHDAAPATTTTSGPRPQQTTYGKNGTQRSIANRTAVRLAPDATSSGGSLFLGQPVQFSMVQSSDNVTVMTHRLETQLHTSSSAASSSSTDETLALANSNDILERSASAPLPAPTSSTSTSTSAMPLKDHGMLFHVSLFDVRRDMIEDGIEKCKHKFGRKAYRRLTGRIYNHAYSSLLRTAVHDKHAEQRLTPILYGTLAGDARDLLAPQHVELMPTSSSSSSSSSSNVPSWTNDDDVLKRPCTELDKMFAPTDASYTYDASARKKTARKAATILSAPKSSVRELDVDLDTHATHARLENIHMMYTPADVSRYNYMDIDLRARVALLRHETGSANPTQAQLNEARLNFGGDYPRSLLRSEQAERATRADVSAGRASTSSSASTADSSTTMQHTKMSETYMHFSSTPRQPLLPQLTAAPSSSTSMTPCTYMSVERQRQLLLLPPPPPPSSSSLIDEEEDEDGEELDMDEINAQDLADHFD